MKHVTDLELTKISMSFYVPLLENNHPRGHQFPFRVLPSVAAELLKGGLKAETGKSTLIQTRKNLHRGWQAVSEILARERQPELAVDVRRFADQMAPPHSEREWISAQLLGHVPHLPTRQR